MVHSRVITGGCGNCRAYLAVYLEPQGIDPPEQAPAQAGSRITAQKDLLALLLNRKPHNYSIRKPHNYSIRKPHNYVTRKPHTPGLVFPFFSGSSGDRIVTQPESRVTTRLGIRNLLW